jgi:DNA-binding winged helix-turn-helix (wHTH) protein
MPTTSPLPAIFQFGVFQLDLNAGELHKAGIKVKLQDQPFRVLAVLVEHAGQVVTRDELRQKVWPSNVYVDFDQGLNNAIKKVREALGDAADSPRLIETVARHGYRFISPVSAVPAPPPPTPGPARITRFPESNCNRLDCGSPRRCRVLGVASIGQAHRATVR